MADIHVSRPLPSRSYDEREESDRTITPLTWKRSHSHAQRREAQSSQASRSPMQRPYRGTNASRRHRPVTAMSFFPDTTDEEDSTQAAALPEKKPTDMARNTMRWLASRQSSSDHPSAAQLHVGEISFPITRSVLWDRRALGPSFTLHPSRFFPRFRVPHPECRRLFEMYRELHFESPSQRIELGALVGALEDHSPKPTITLGRDAQRYASTKLAWRMPVVAVANSDELQTEQEAHDKLVMESQAAWSNYALEQPHQNFFPSLMICGGEHPCQLRIRFECLVPQVSFQLTPVRNLPILMTALGACLSHSGKAGHERCGLLTLDRTRKAVPLLKDDPLAFQRPLVGVWVAMKDHSCQDPDDVEALSQCGALYLACLGYMLTKTVRERVEVAKSTFLVAVYGSNLTASNGVSIPRFFECSAHGELHPAPHCEALAVDTTCFAGIDSMEQGLLLEVKGPFTAESQHCSAVDEGTQEGSADAPIATCMAPRAGVNERKTRQCLPKVKTVGEQAQSSENQMLRSSSGPKGHTVEDLAAGTNLNRAVSNELVESKVNLTSSRSCCRSQRAMTLHHEEMLKRQQDQLQRMQEEIQRLKDAIGSKRAVGTGWMSDADVQEDLRGETAQDQGCATSRRSDRSASIDECSSVNTSTIERRFGSQVSSSKSDPSNSSTHWSRDSTRKLRVSSSSGKRSSTSATDSAIRTGNTDSMSLAELETPALSSSDSLPSAPDRQPLNPATPRKEPIKPTSSLNGSPSSTIASFAKLRAPALRLTSSTGGSPSYSPPSTNAPLRALSNGSIPRISFRPDDSLWDSDDEEVARIERKYAALLPSRTKLT